MKINLDKKNWKLMSQRQRMSPFPNYMSMEAVTLKLKKYVGVNLSKVILIFEDRLMNGFLERPQCDDAGRSILSRIKRQPKLYSGLIQKQENLGGVLVKYCKAAAEKIKPGMSGRELYELFAGYDDRYSEVYADYGSVWVVENMLNAELVAVVGQRIKSPDEAAKAVNLLTLQPSAMVARIEREALLGLAAKAAEKAGWLRQVKAQKVNDPALKNLINAHVAKYFWVTRDYEDPVLDFEKTLVRLKEVASRTSSQAYKAMVEERLDIPKQKARLAKRLKLNNKEKQLFASMMDIAYLKELRKRYVSESLYYFDAVLEEIGRRTGLTIKQVRFLRTSDVKAGLLERRNLRKLAADRVKLSAWISDKHGTYVATGPEAQRINRELVGEFNANAREFRGQPVSPGVARGPVRIVMNPDEVGKVKKGDIIVSVQVVPSFSAAIHRAAGLICDGGHGVTTHPAILAREAKIPAIIQTKFARLVLKDGDMVEVDGYKGVARKL